MHRASAPLPLAQAASSFRIGPAAETWFVLHSTPRCAEETRLAVLEKLTGGDKKRPIVFLCLNAECWLSYNASLYAAEAGHEDVIWYRGGSQAWLGASLDSKTPQSVDW